MKNQKASARRPLRGFRIVTLAVNVPVPVAASRLAELGAAVVKIEPAEGDALSIHCPAWYGELTRKQRILRLNLKDRVDRTRLDSWLAQSDLLLTSTRPDSLRRLSLGWKQLHSRFPRLSQVALLGHPAPREEIAGHDLTYQAQLGLLSPPAMPVTLWADLAGAEAVFSAALLVLLSRRRMRSGVFQAVSIEEATARFAAPLRYGITAPEGILGGGWPQYGLYRASDGWIAVAAFEPKFSSRLQEELHLPRLDREQLATVFAARTAQEWEQWALRRDLPISALHPCLKK